MITKYIVIVQTGEHNYKPFGSFKTLEDAECFQQIMGGSIEHIECFEKGE